MRAVTVLLGIGCGLAGMGLVVLLMPRRRHRAPGPGLAIAVVASAVGAAILSSAAPTGTEFADVLLRAAIGAGAAAVGAKTSGRTRTFLAATSAAAALGFGSSLAVLAGGVLGVAIGLLSAGATGRVGGAVLSGGAVLPLLRLDHAGAYGSAVAAGTVLVVLAVIGFRSAPAWLRRRIRAGLVAAAVLGAVAVAALAPTLASGVRQARQAVAVAQAAFEGARSGDREAAVRDFGQAETRFRAAHRRLSAWYLRPSLLVPVAAQHARAAERLTAIGADLSAAARGLAQAADPSELHLVKGRINVGRIAALAAPSRRVLDSLLRASETLRKVQSPWLLDVVASPTSRLASKVRGAVGPARTSVLATEVVPGLLGANGERHYFVAFDTPAELRGSGGIIGSYAEIVAKDGALKLSQQGSDADLNTKGVPPTQRHLVAPADYLSRYAQFTPERFWQNVTMSPDFPTVGGVISSLYPQSGGGRIDGVVAIDPVALAALVHLTGPLHVPLLRDEAITTDNAAEFLLHDQYVRFAETERTQFVAQLSTALFDRLTSIELAGPAEIARVLGPVTRQGHMHLWAASQREQALFVGVGADGSLAPVRGDALEVVNQNASGNKIDYYLRRSADYQVRYAPGSGEVRATLTLEFDNSAPNTGLPAYVINGSRGATQTQPGENLTLLSVYSPLNLLGATLDRQPVGLQVQRELGRNVLSTYVLIPSKGRRILRIELAGQVAPGSYWLDVGRQPTVAADALDISLIVPDRWRATGLKGLRARGSRLYWTGRHDTILTVGARFRE